MHHLLSTLSIMGTQTKLEKMLLPVVPCPLLMSSDA
jgi:hypothetical protein